MRIFLAALLLCVAGSIYAHPTTEGQSIKLLGLVQNCEFVGTITAQSGAHTETFEAIERAKYKVALMGGDSLKVTHNLIDPHGVKTVVGMGFRCNNPR